MGVIGGTSASHRMHFSCLYTLHDTVIRLLTRTRTHRQTPERYRFHLTFESNRHITYRYILYVYILTRMHVHMFDEHQW